MPLVTKAEYARHHGKTRAAVQKWEAAGYLVFRDGKVDVEASDEKLRGANLGRFKPGSAVSGPAHEESDEESVEVSAEAWTRAEAERQKEVYLAQLRRLEFEQKSGALVPLETAERVIFEAARQARDAWRNWATRTGALVAADLGVEADAVTEALKAHVHEHLDDLGTPNIDFGAAD